MNLALAEDVLILQSHRKSCDASSALSGKPCLQLRKTTCRVLEGLPSNFLADVVRQNRRLTAAGTYIKEEPQQEVCTLFSRHIRRDVWLSVRHDHQVLPDLLPQTGCTATHWHQLRSGGNAAVCGYHVILGFADLPHVW